MLEISSKLYDVSKFRRVNEGAVRVLLMTCIQYFHSHSEKLILGGHFVDEWKAPLRTPPMSAG